MPRAVLITLGVLALLVALVVLGVPWLVQTEWARQRIRASLEEGTGRAVSLGDVRFGWGSGLEAHNVRVAQKQRELRSLGPLFTMDRLRIRVGLGELWHRRLSLEELSAVRPEIVLVRSADGTLNIDDLLERPAHRRAPLRANVRVEDGRILFVDRRLGSRIEASELDGRATYDEGEVAVRLDGKLNGGVLALQARAGLGQVPARLVVDRFEIDGAALAADLRQLGFLVPLFGEAPERASGKLTVKLAQLRASGLDRAQLSRSLVGHGELRITDGTLASPPVHALLTAVRAVGRGDLAAALPGADAGELRFIELQAAVRFANGRVYVEPMRVDAGPLRLSAHGSTSFAGAMSYAVRIEGLDDVLRLPPALTAYLRREQSLPFRLSGTLAKPALKLDVKAAAGAATGAFEGELERRIAPETQEQLEKLLGPPPKEPSERP